MKLRILIVDDEPRMAESLAVALRRDDYLCATATSGERALELFEKEGADVVVTDRRMPEMSGEELLWHLRERAPELPVILMTAYGDVRSAVKAMRDGAFDYLTKPFDHDELRSVVSRALEMDRLKRENRQLRDELGARFVDSVIADSPAMKAVLERVDRAAPSDATVLIQGESGTGKEVVAKRLHYASRRVGHPFVAINCKAFAPGVIESELFGHEKGAFTGAGARRRGCFERADGGTLFLDEIGELETAFQAKLLRVLQEREILPVGGDTPLPVDVRFVAATNRDLEGEIDAGRFREDFYYRLNVIPVHLPALRERREDILPLARHFLGRLGENGRRLELGEDAVRVLEAHAWPGNVRELENVLERARVLARGEEITADDLLLENARGASSEPSPIDGTLQDALDHAAAERIRTALTATDGHRAEAARHLGIDRTTLFRWIKRLEL